jgi:hypothetical protein
MPWSATLPQAGFTTGKPWLPVAAEHVAHAVDTQMGHPNSLLQFYKALLRWRKTMPALVTGAMQVLPGHDQVLAFTRNDGVQSVLCAFNFSDSDVSWELPALAKNCTPIAHSPFANDGNGEGVTDSAGASEGASESASLQGATIRFAPWGVLVALL